jgi:hypothetical protein
MSATATEAYARAVSRAWSAFMLPPEVQVLVLGRCAELSGEARARMLERTVAALPEVVALAMDDVLPGEPDRRAEDPLRPGQRPQVGAGGPAGTPAAAPASAPQTSALTLPGELGPHPGAGAGKGPGAALEGPAPGLPNAADPLTDPYPDLVDLGLIELPPELEP